MRIPAFTAGIMLLGMATADLAFAQRRDGLPTAARQIAPAIAWTDSGLVSPRTPLVAASAPPARWPFVLTGALLGGAIAGAWYVNQVSHTDDPMGPIVGYGAAVVGIGIGVGGLTGLIVSEVVRATRKTTPAT